MRRGTRSRADTCTPRGSPCSVRPALRRSPAAGRECDDGLHLFAVAESCAMPMTAASTIGLVGVEHLFDLARIHVEAAAQDHVLLAVDDAVAAVVVTVADVARVEPAVTHGTPWSRRGGRGSPSSRCGRGCRSRRARRRAAVARLVVEDAHLDAPDRVPDRARPSAACARAP